MTIKVTKRQTAHDLPFRCLYYISYYSYVEDRSSANHTRWAIVLVSSDRSSLRHGVMIHKGYGDDVVYDEDNVDGDCCFANLSKNDLIGQLM